ncbi:phosphorybosylanthranilate isomerase, partial [bacterium]|nr:phosphorybosylanthranilate isomerase [bacterium]
LSAVAVAASVGARFVRVNVHTGAAVTDQGIIQGDARSTLLAIRETAPDLAVFADVFVKHASPLGSTTLEREAADAVERGGASALIVTGEATGAAASLDDAARITAILPDTPILVGSGVTVDTIPRILDAVSGIIIGSAVMAGGRAGNPVDADRAIAIARAAGRDR